MPSIATTKSLIRSSVIQLLTGLTLGSGNVFYVDSGHTNAKDYADHGKDPTQPYATIDYAVGRCTASNGDLIVVAPGHVETVSAAGGLALDVAGITLVGLGNGRNRPQINFTATTSTMTVSAANVKMSGFRFSGGIDAVASCVVVSAADFELYDFEYTDDTGQCTVFLLTTAGADRMHLHDFEYNGDTAAGTGAAIAIVGGDGIKIHDFIMDGNFSVGGIDIRTTATTDLKVYNCWSFRTRNAADIFIIDTITASTGQIGPNIYLRLQDNAANITEAITGATFVQHLPISIVNHAGEVGMTTNATVSTDA